MTDTLLPPTARRVVYAVLFLLGVVLGGLHVAFESVTTPDPSWLTAASAVYAYLMAPATGVLALLNVAPRGEHVADE